jgi:hypothetical protein
MQPDDNTAVESQVPAETQTAEVEPEVIQTPTANETQAPDQSQTPDYKSLYEEESRRRAGLDRKLQRLTREQTRTGGEDESFLTGDEAADSAAFNHPLTQKLLAEVAERQLKEGVEEIVSRYPNVPEQVIKAIKANPRGFVGYDTKTVPDALEDIENYIFDTFGESTTVVETPKDFPVVQPNVVSTEPKEKSIEEMSADELSEAIDNGDVSLKDTERIIKEQHSGKEVKKVK